jgi:hypothetical protein
MKRSWNKRKKKVIRVVVQTKLTDADKLREQRTIEYILKIVQSTLKVDENFATTKNRKRELVYARQVSMYLIFRFSTCSLERIGEIFGGKDHATIIHARKTIANLMETDKSIYDQVMNLEEVVKLNIDMIKENLDLSKEFYYINFNNHVSIQLNEKKGMILTGFTEEEISKIKELFPPMQPLRKHQNTGLYILEKKEENKIN